MLRELAWVIFDEVHYMQDRERGVVWEETIIFLPKETKMVRTSLRALCHSWWDLCWLAALRVNGRMSCAKRVNYPPADSCSFPSQRVVP